MSSTNTLEAERADRISRLAGLERVATARASSSNNNNNNTPTTHPLASGGYFDSQQSHKERSTVGSASATGSVGGRTTWASGSDAFEADSKASEDTMDDGTSSVSNASDEGNASLVGFGEGASTISGPISSRPNLNRVSSGGGRTPSSLSSPSINNRVNPLAAHLQANTSNPSDSPMVPSPSPMSPAGSSSIPDQQPAMAVDDARMLDGMTYDADVVDTTMRTPRLATFHRSGSHNDTGSGSAGSSEPGR